MVLVTFCSTILLYCGTHIAFKRPLTVVCRFCSDIAMLMFTWMAFSFLLWQLGRRTPFTCTLLVNLVHLSFNNRHFSLKELIISLNTSLVFNGITTWSIVLKAILHGAKVRMLIISRSTIVDASCLALTTLEAFFPPLCGFAQDF